MMPKQRVTMLSLILPFAIVFLAFFLLPMARLALESIDVLPIVIYTEFTLSANVSMASALSIFLGLITWGVLAAARSASGETLAASG